MTDLTLATEYGLGGQSLLLFTSEEEETEEEVEADAEEEEVELFKTKSEKLLLIGSGCLTPNIFTGHLALIALFISNTNVFASGFKVDLT